MLVEKPLFGIGFHGKSPDVSANRLVNAYYEFKQENDGTRVAIYGTPGFTMFMNQGDTPWRALLSFLPNSLLYGVHRDVFYEINNAGISTARGTIGTSTGRCDISDDGFNIIVTDGTEVYVYDTRVPATPIAAVTDVDRPISPNTCIVQAGRVLTDENNTGEFKASGAYTPTVYDALDYATAETVADNIVRIVNYRGTATMMGSHSIEYFANVGGSGLPYAVIAGATQEMGLHARWSVGRFLGSYAFLAKSREGQFFVAMLEGYSVKRISNDDLDYLINNYIATQNASGFGYMLGGHAMYQINFPSSGKSWLYDGSTKYWTELRYGNDGRHRGEIAVDYINKTIVTDYENGKMYSLTATAFTDDGMTSPMVLTGRHISKGKRKFRISSLEIGIEPATTTDQSADPVAGLRISKDGGHSFSTQTFSKMGKIGEYLTRCIWRRLGLARDVVPEITISEPMKRVITDATLNIEDGSS